jgi:hypothetical protein
VRLDETGRIHAASYMNRMVRKATNENKETIRKFNELFDTDWEPRRISKKNQKKLKNFKK